MGNQAYLIRYGAMGHVSRFRTSPECDHPLGRGQPVVIQTDRGVELGEVLLPIDESDAVPTADRQRVVRPARPEDLDRSRRAEAMRSERFALCQRILREGEWPWELIDVEPTLDDRATVLHYLGPHRLDAATLRARFRMTCDFDVVLEPVGADVGFEEDDDHASAHHGGGCGSGGCGSGGSGGEVQRPDPASAGHTASSHSGCDSCGIGRLMAARGRVPRPIASTS
ncbi:MAG: PSP1 C-terminal domain-containing protein [Isosphaeraceae bacterium]